MNEDLDLPSLAEQQDLEAAWAAICEKLDRSPTFYPLRFGPQFDWTRAIFRHGDGWAVLDIMRGEELSRRFLPDRDALLYDYAKGATEAIAGWHLEKNMSPLSNRLAGIFHRLDRRFNLRLQLRQANNLLHAHQLGLMRLISPEWSQRLQDEFVPTKIIPQRPIAKS